MKIVVLSDTHMPKKGRTLPGKLLRELDSADYIIHAGDWQTIELYNELGKYAEVKGVTGNVDSPELKAKLNSKEILVVNDFRIGIVHGHGSGKTTERRAQDAFKDERVDWIVYGHSHIPVLKELAGTILFNPGSPTDKRRQKEFSFGIMTVTDVVRAEHIFYSDRT
ncbi:metallophosphoesterase [Bacillus sp. REN3]|uniref:metallophosphoesterase family protein n=1 Tax=Bacillus sp. REN3 TaxID=2802440 RepID=UPI001AED156C|nr:metallophosphoesterase [Bacillus sp. REN3]